MGKMDGKIHQIDGEKIKNIEWEKWMGTSTILS